MRSLTIRAATSAAIVTALVLSLGACGSDYDEDLVGALKAQGASQEEAECFIDELGEDDARAFVELGDETPEEADLDKYLAAVEKCGVDGGGE